MCEKEGWNGFTVMGIRRMVMTVEGWMKYYQDGAVLWDEVIPRGMGATTKFCKNESVFSSDVTEVEGPPADDVQWPYMYCC